MRNTVVVKLSLTDIVIRPALAKGGTPRSDSFDEMISRLKPYAAINGTFYDTARMEPIGDIVIDGKLVKHGIYRIAIAVRNDGKVEFIRAKNGNFEWKGYKTALASGPMLVQNGRIALNSADGLSQHVFLGRACRSGVGVTKDGKLLLVVAKDRITLAQFAHIMLNLHALHAMNLDGGEASGLYANGRILIKPSLRMTNLLTVSRR
jgi:exopolysaccharide biosynthesis protein